MGSLIGGSRNGVTDRGQGVGSLIGAKEWVTDRESRVGSLIGVKGWGH